MENLRETGQSPELENEEREKTGEIEKAKRKFENFLNELEEGHGGYWSNSAQELCEIYGFDLEKVKGATEKGKATAQRLYENLCEEVVEKAETHPTYILDEHIMRIKRIAEMYSLSKEPLNQAEKAFEKKDHKEEEKFLEERRPF